jgi:predicted nuclease of predicted toxin-antitoxin system
MRVFLDACIDPRVAALLEGHQVTTAFDLGWHTLPDPELLRRIQDQFDAFVTTDQGFEFQHNLRRLRFGIVIVHVPKNKVEFYRPLVNPIQDALNQTKSGAVFHVR